MLRLKLGTDPELQRWGCMRIVGQCTFQAIGLTRFLRQQCDVSFRSSRTSLTLGCRSCPHSEVRSGMHLPPCRAQQPGLYLVGLTSHGMRTVCLRQLSCGPLTGRLGGGDTGPTQPVAADLSRQRPLVTGACQRGESTCISTSMFRLSQPSSHACIGSARQGKRGTEHRKAKREGGRAEGSRQRDGPCIRHVYV